MVPGQRIGVAVSGGVDSVCLFHILRSLSEEWRWDLTVLHVDHQLRGPESLGDAEFVEALAREAGLPFYLHRAELDLGGENLEQAARDVRRRFFQQMREEHRLDCVALGHTRTDQAETVLFRFLRGSGLAGLSGMPVQTPDGRVRPLLEQDRSTLENYLRERGLSWREDSTNKDTGFARNRIRHELLPQLTREWNPELGRSLVQLAGLASAEEDYWAQEMARLGPGICERAGDAVLIPINRLTELPLAVARRLIRWAFLQVRGDLRQIEYQHVDSALILATQADGHGRFQAPGLDIFRSFDWIRISPPAEGTGMTRFFEIDVPGAGEYLVPIEKTRIFLYLQPYPPDPDCRYTGEAALIDAARCSTPFLLRSWRPGDQFRIPGRGPKKLKLLFQEERIPLWERRFWPILTTGDEIVWARGFGVAEPFQVSEATKQVWLVREERETAPL